jgi:hypothetical protein
MTTPRSRRSIPDAVREIDSDDIALVDELTRSRCCPIEILISFPVALLLPLSLTFIPDYIPLNLFDNLTRTDQPICAPIDSRVPALSRILFPLSLAFFSSFIAKTKGDVVVGTLYSLLFAFHSRTAGLLFQSAGTSLMFFLLIIAHFFSHNILTVRVYSWKWFINLLISWAFALSALFIRPDVGGSLAGLFVCCFISALSEVTAVTGNRRKQIRQSGKLILCLNVVAIPLTIGITAARYKWGSPKVVHSGLTTTQIAANGSMPIVGLIAISLVLIRYAKHQYVEVIPFLEGAVGGCCSLWLPLQSAGNTAAVRVFFARFNFLLASGVVCARIRNCLIRYGLPALALTAVFVIRTVELLKNGE